MSQVLESSAAKHIHSFFNMPNFLKFFTFGCFIYFLALFGLLRADIFYIDDWGRVIYGDNWNNFSRYVATFLQRHAQFTMKFTDIAPLYQLLGIFVLVLSSMWLIYALRGKVSYLSILALVPLGLSPYFLENLSYRYDSFLMSCAICFAIIPFGFYRHKFLFFITSFVCLMLLFGTYQATNSIYLLIGLYIIALGIFIERKKISEIASFGIAWAGSFVLAAVVYKKAFVKPVNDYVSTETLSLGEIMGGGGVNNLTTYLSLLYSDFTSPRFYIFYLILCAFVLFIIYFVRGGDFRFNITKNSAFYGFKGYLLRFIGAILFLCVGLILSYGAYLVLKKPLFEPRAFNGIGLFMSLLCFSLIFLESSKLKNMCEKILHYISATLIILLAYGLIVFANAYADALSAQQRYTDFRAQKLLDDLMRVVPLDSTNLDSIESKGLDSIKPVRYTIIGNIGYAMPTAYTISRFGNIMNRLIPVHLSGNWYHGAMLFSNLKSPYVNDAYAPGAQVCKDIKEQDRILLEKNMYQSIYKAGECVIIHLHKGYEKGR